MPRTHNRTRGVTYGAYDLALPKDNPEFRAWRLNLGINQAQAAELLGFSRPMVALMDQGKRVPTKPCQLAMRAIELEGVEKQRDTATALALQAVNLLPSDHIVTPLNVSLDRRDLTPLAQDIAALEGWGVFPTEDDGLEIQRLDDAGVFADDDEARAYVAAQAAKGSTLHAIAVSLVKTA